MFLLCTDSLLRRLSGLVGRDMEDDHGGGGGGRAMGHENAIVEEVTNDKIFHILFERTKATKQNKINREKK